MRTLLLLTSSTLLRLLVELEVLASADRVIGDANNLRVQQQFVDLRQLVGCQLASKHWNNHLTSLMMSALNQIKPPTLLFLTSGSISRSIGVINLLLSESSYSIRSIWPLTYAKKVNEGVLLWLILTLSVWVNSATSSAANFLLILESKLGSWISISFYFASIIFFSSCLEDASFPLSFVQPNTAELILPMMLLLSLSPEATTTPLRFFIITYPTSKKKTIVATFTRGSSCDFNWVSVASLGRLAYLTIPSYGTSLLLPFSMMTGREGLPNESSSRLPLTLLLSSKPLR